MLDVFTDDLSYAVSVYDAGQVRPHAEKCRDGKCVSFIHCFYGRPRLDGGVPLPICAQHILRRLERREEVK